MSVPKGETVKIVLKYRWVTVFTYTHLSFLKYCYMKMRLFQTRVFFFFARLPTKKQLCTKRLVAETLEQVHNVQGFVLCGHTVNFRK